MSEKPFFSVIVNTHNSEKTIKKTLNSVLNQSFKDFEVVIVDDYSTDDTLKILYEIRNKYQKDLIIIELENNKGIAYSRNIGIEKSRGKYISFLDGDDLWKTDKLLIQYKVLKESSYTIDWLFSNYDVIDSNYNYLGKRIRSEGVYGYKAILKEGNPVGMLTVVVKSNVLKKNRFRDMKHEDYDLWIRLSHKGYFGVLINRELAKYMKHNNTASSNKLKSIFWTFQVFRKNNIGFFSSLIFFGGYIVNT